MQKHKSSIKIGFYNLRYLCDHWGKQCYINAQNNSTNAIIYSGKHWSKRLERFQKRFGKRFVTNDVTIKCNIIKFLKPTFYKKKV